MKLVAVQPNGISFADDIGEKESVYYQLIRVGDFHFGEGKITAEMIGEMAANFAKNATRLSLDGKAVLPINYSHRPYDEAAGWITGVEARDNNQSLWFTADWTEKGKAAVKERRYAFISAEIHPSYIDSETGDKYGAALLGAGLTNIPEVREMEQINLSQQKKEVKMTDELKKEIEAKALDFAKKEIEFQKREGEYKEKILAFERREKELTEEVGKLRADAAMAAKVAKFESMVASGKACEAQREAYIAGDMDAFAEKASSIEFSKKQSSSSAPSNEEKDDYNSPAYFDKISNRLKDKGIQYSADAWYKEHIAFTSQNAGA